MEDHIWEFLNNSKIINLKMEEYRLCAILDSNSEVINIVTFPQNPEPNIIEEEVDGVIVEKEIIPQPEDLLSFYPEGHSILEYSQDKSITNNQASPGSVYNQHLNAFITTKPDETYILNQNTFEWEPNPDIEYDLHNDGNLYKWIGSGWIINT